MRRRALLRAGLLAPLAAHAGEPAWPDRPLRLLVAYPPGGLSDETARALAQGAGPLLGQPVLVEHRAGAGGVAAMEALARAAPDGHTLGYCAISPLVIAPLLGRPGYDAQRDFTPVLGIVDTPVLVLAHPDFRPDSFAALIAFARAAPGRLRWASSGLATVGHLVLEQVMRASGTRITHVPYKGGGQQLSDALSGQFEVLSSNAAAQQLQYVRQGRLKALAVGAPQRLAVLPEVPTLAELGFPAANLVSSFGIFAPRGLAPARLARLNAVFNAALQQRALRERLAQGGNLPTGGSAAAFARHIERQRALALQLLPALQSPASVETQRRFQPWALGQG